MMGCCGWRLVLHLQGGLDGGASYVVWDWEDVDKISCTYSNTFKIISFVIYFPYSALFEFHSRSLSILLQK